jgi:hypothetical protein
MAESIRSVVVKIYVDMECKHRFDNPEVRR